MLSFLTTHKKNIGDILRDFLAAEEARLAPISRRSARLAKDCAELAIRGKMVRGELVCLGYTLDGGAVDETCLKLAATIELAHTALLIHDDIMDGDTLRRGKPALHARYSSVAAREKIRNPNRFGEATATCLADMAFFWAFNLATQALAPHPELLLKTMALLTEELACVGAAQAQDIWSGNHPEPASLATIMATYRYKTARYTFSLPLVLGITAAQGNASMARSLSSFGEHIGIIFQLRDDALGLFGDENEIGKPVGSDIREGKKTLYHYFLWRLADNAERKRLAAIFGNPKLTDKDMAFVRALVERYGIKQRIEAIVAKETRSARKILAETGLTEGQRATFEALTTYIVERHS